MLEQLDGGAALKVDVSDRGQQRLVEDLPGQLLLGQRLGARSEGNDGRLYFGWRRERVGLEREQQLRLGPPLRDDGPP